MRQHSIKTSNIIHHQLIENGSVMELIPEENIYLCVAEMNTDYPYLTIRRTGVQSERGNKDFSGDIVTFNIAVYSDKYDEAVDIADAVRLALEGWIIESVEDDARLENIEVTSATEDWVQDAYEQTVSFKAEVVKPIDN